MSAFQPINDNAYRLMIWGMQTFADMESRGFLIDDDYLTNAGARLQDEILAAEAEFKDTRLCRVWSDTFGSNTNFQSSEQLAEIIYDKLGHEAIRQTKGGKGSTDEESLSAIPEPGLDQLVKIRQRQKAIGTYLKNLGGEKVNNLIHPFYNLHTTATFRSSSSEPNFQNIPIRNPDIGPVIRRAIIAPPDFHFCEVDISGAEVRVGACYHHDPAMLGYVTDSSRDMHRDTAMELFNIPIERMAKPLRQVTKGDMVFAQFYGAAARSCAVKLWRKIVGLKTADGVLVTDHLKASLGIDTYGKFEEWVQKIADSFWNVRFKVYTQWKETRWQEYLQKGFFDTLTGFRCGGLMSRNAVTNYPIQGSAFHVLLRLTIDLNNWLKREKLKTQLIGQVHDSAILYLHVSEVKKVLDFIATWFGTIHKSWKWITVPLEYEVELSPPGKSWADKKVWTDAA